MEGKYLKICPVCRRKFTTDARNRKFCEFKLDGTPSECGKKDIKRKKRNRREYKKNAEALKIKAAAHRLAVQVLENSDVKKACVVTGSEKELEAHHHNVNYLDNRNRNLTWLRHDIHDKVHSYIEKMAKKWTDAGNRLSEKIYREWSLEAIQTLKG